jgi:hypothetical protein
MEKDRKRKKARERKRENESQRKTDRYSRERKTKRDLPCFVGVRYSCWP